jgi:hypothetical protein
MGHVVFSRCDDDGISCFQSVDLGGDIQLAGTFQNNVQLIICVAVASGIPIVAVIQKMPVQPQHKHSLINGQFDILIFQEAGSFPG